MTVYGDGDTAGLLNVGGGGVVPGTEYGSADGTVYGLDDGYGCATVGNCTRWATAGTASESSIHWMPAQRRRELRFNGSAALQGEKRVLRAECSRRGSYQRTGPASTAGGRGEVGGRRPEVRYGQVCRSRDATR